MINKTQQHCSTLGFLLTVSLATSAQAGQAEPPTTLTLHVYNRAQVPGRALAQPARDVERIFRQMGVEALWLDSPGPSGKKQVNPPAPRRADSSGLQVRIYIVSREAADLVRPKKARIQHELGRRTLALSAPGRVGNGAGIIYLFYDRVQDLLRAQRKTEYRDQLLGLVIAHEIGHLLLPDHSHSKTGIMRAMWDEQDLQLAAHGELGFTPEQVELIRSELLR